MLLLGKYGVRRVCVVAAGGSAVTNIITQSAIIAFLVAHMPAFAGLVNLTLQELEMVRSESVITISPAETCWTALRLMCLHVRTYA